MAIQVIISDLDKTKQIVMNSLKIQNILTNKRDTCDFSIVSHSGDSYVPNMGSEVIILDGATRVFGGVITRIESVPMAFSAVQHKIFCQDYTRLFDKRLIPDTYENETAEAIIQQLKDNYFPTGFTIDNVVAPVEIKYVSFQYKPLSVCMQMLADMIGYDWYIDYNKDVHFFEREIRVAPFSLSDTGGKYRYNSLVIRKDNSQVRNSIIVRGGEYIGSQTSFDIQTNGVDFTFPLPYKFADFAAHLTGEVLNIGDDTKDPADAFDALYNFKEKIIRFKEADKPSASKTLIVSGKPYFPVIVRYRSPASIATMSAEEGGDGTYEYLIKDDSINTKAGARQRAQAEILAYAETLSEGEFITESSGLVAGQSITVQSDSRGLDETFVINRVTVTQFTVDTFLYSVSLITTKTMDLIDILKKLLLDKNNTIDVSPGDISETIIAFEDIGTFTDTLGTFSSHGGAYRYGVDGQQGRWNFATWS